MRSKIEYIIKHNVIIQKVYKFTFSIFFRILGLFIKVDSNLVFFTGHGGKVNDSPKKIYEYMLNHPKYEGFTLIWGVKDTNRYSNIIENVVEIDTLRYFLLSLRAKYWIASVNIERGLNYKKRKTIYLNTWHGVPIKTIGNSAAKRKDYNFSSINYFVVSGDYEKSIYTRDFNVNKSSIIETGMPRNDELYFQLNEDRKEKILSLLEIDRNKKIILYAPTWRDSQNNGESYHISPPINLNKWEKELSKDFVLLLRTHPYTTKLLNIKFNDFVRDLSSYEDVNDLIQISDLLITDYSAISFDYSITEKPMYSFAYDLQDYIKNRGIYINLENEFPGGVINNENDLLEKIKMEDKSVLVNEVINFKRKYIQYGGNSTAKCLDILMGGN